MSVLFLIVALVILLIIGTPVAVALGVASFLCIFVIGDHNLFFLVFNAIINQSNSYIFSAIPLFIFAGRLLEVAGGSSRVYNFFAVLFGQSRRAASFSTALTAILYPDISADTITSRNDFSVTTVNNLREAGFDSKWSLGMGAAMTSVAVIAPPSVLLILLGIVLQISIGTLFLGTIIFVIILVMAFFLLSLIFANGKERFPKPKQITKVSFIETLPWLFTPVVILGSIFLGVTTPTEAGAIGVGYVAVLGVVQRSLTTRQVARASIDTLQTMGAILLVVIFSSAFSSLLFLEGTPKIFAEWVISKNFSPLLVLFVLSMLFIASSNLLGPIASIMILSPVLFPVAIGLTLNAVQIGIVIALSAAAGIAIPPFGSVFAALARGTDESPIQSAKATAAFVIPLIAVLMLAILFPYISQIVINLFW